MPDNRGWVQSWRTTLEPTSTSEYMSWNTLPVELTLQIIENHLCPDISVGQIGEAAAWTKLWHTEARPWELEEEQICNGDDLETVPESAQALITNPWSALRSLSLTCKYLYKLCVPFVYRDFMSTANSWNPSPNVNMASKWVEHGSSVRNVRILLDPESAILLSYWEFLTEVLASFKKVTSLGIYYRSCHVFPRRVADQCINILRTGNVRELGIYSVMVLHRETGNTYWDRFVPRFAYDVIRQYTSSTAAASNLRVLDLVVETIPTEIYNLVRTQLPNLRTMNIRRALRYPTLGRIWDANQVQYWRHNDNLTRLSLIDCSSAYAFHIPHLVRHFTSLRELIVSTCGAGGDDRIGILRSGGWSTESNALCKTHVPLDVFHIEYMTDWEIGALGVIPTRELVTSLLMQGHLEAVFTRDPEIFPGLVILKVEDYVDVEATAYFAPGMANPPRTVKSLSAICAERGLKIERDAKWIRRSFLDC